MNTQMFKFHPVRFFELRKSDLWEVAVRRHIEAIKKERSLCLISVGESLMHEHEDHGGLIKPGMEEMVFPMERIKSAFDEENGCGAYILEGAIEQWATAGEQIFDVSAISAMFVDSDISDMPIRELKLPYKAFYLHWGAHLALPSAVPGRYIDGCYVHQNLDLSSDGHPDLVFTFSSCLSEGDRWQDRSLLANIVVDGEGAFDCDTTFFTEGKKKTVGSVVSEALEGEAYDSGFSKRWGPYIDQAMSMAVNCLCYVTSKQSEIVAEYPSSAPERLIRHCVDKSAKRRERARSKLNSLGFRMINMCGRSLATRVGIVEGSSTMPPHWRRGHWHKVRFGTKWSEVRVDWREATVVNASFGEAQGRRIYKKAA
jgi:hypothetical protein